MVSLHLRFWPKCCVIFTTHSKLRVIATFININLAKDSTEFRSRSHERRQNTEIFQFHLVISRDKYMIERIFLLIEIKAKQINHKIKIEKVQYKQLNKYNKI